MGQPAEREGLGGNFEGSAGRGCRTKCVYPCPVCGDFHLFSGLSAHVMQGFGRAASLYLDELAVRALVSAGYIPELPGLYGIPSKYSVVRQGFASEHSE